MASLDLVTDDDRWSYSSKGVITYVARFGLMTNTGFLTYFLEDVANCLVHGFCDQNKSMGIFFHLAS